MTFPQVHVDGEVWDGAAVTSLEARAAAFAADTVVPLGSISGAVTCDISQGVCFTGTQVGACTFTFTGWPAGDVLIEPLLVLTQDGSGGRAITVSGVTWLPDGTPPTFDTTAGAINVVSLSSPDQGVTIYGADAAGGTTTSALAIANQTVPDSLNDNTGYLQGLVNSTAAAGQTLVIPKGQSGHWVVSQLTLPSNASVDATGATFIQLSGTNTRMILNTSLTLGTPGSSRDSNISWVGGTFVKGTGQTNVGKLVAGGGGLGDHCTMFGFVDGLTVKNITITQSGTGGDAGTGGRYGCYVWNCTNFYFENYKATSASGAVNQSSLQVAYSQNGYIRGASGSAGDDMVALVNGNQVGDMLANGLSHMENVTVEGVFGVVPSNGVRLMPGSTAGGAPFYNIQHCAIRNVRVTAGSRGSSAAVFIGGALSGYPNLTNGTVQDVEISDVKQVRASTPAVWIAGNAEIFVTLRRVNNLDDSTVVNIPDNTGSHTRVRIVDCVMTPTITSGSQYFVSVVTTTCRSLEFDNVQIQAATTGTATVGLVNGTGGPGWLVARNIRTTGKCYALGTFASTTRIVANGINGEDANGLGFIQTNTGAVVTVRAWNGCFNGGTNANTIVAGTIATNDARLPGANGTAALTGGAATVTTGAGMATASSQIRLATLVPGGTVGHCYVSSRGSNTFAIASTSGSDTSTIFWEIVTS